MIKKIGLLTYQNGIRRGPCDFYPLIKWKEEFKREGLYFYFFNNHDDKKIMNMDIVLIDHRYYRELIVIKEKYPNKDFIIEFISKLKNSGIRVILLDNGDGAGGRQWDLIEYVDVLVKKQVLKDKTYYTENHGKASSMPFLRKYKLSHDRKKKNEVENKEYIPCPLEQVHKIRLGWNIGMLDYRNLPLSRFYPIGTSRLFNTIYKVPHFEKDFSKKTIDSTFRGKIKNNNENYSFQRNRVISHFKQEKYPNLITGDVISKRDYIKELRRSKTCVSPFGWGEVCYRDFEAIMAGCILIKPDMDHLETYPNVYIKNKTYIPLKWDMSDLEEKINEVIENYEQYKEVVYKAQSIYKKAITDQDEFIKRFKKIIE